MPSRSRPAEVATGDPRGAAVDVRRRARGSHGVASRMPRRRLMVTVIVVVAVACAGSVPLGRGAGPAPRVRVDYGSRPRKGASCRSGPRREVEPSAVRWRDGSRCARCLRRDGSRFARLHIDARPACARGGVLPALRGAVERGRQLLRRDLASPANVKCGSSAQATIGTVYWKKTRKWWIGATPGGIEPRRGRQGGQERAERMDEQHQLVRHQGPGEPARVLPGQDVGHGGYGRRQERRRLGQPRERPGLQRGARVHRHVVRREGHPDRVGHQVQHRVQVVDDRRGGRVGHPVGRGARDRSRPPVRPRHERVEGRRNERDVAVLRGG